MSRTQSIAQSKQSMHTDPGFRFLQELTTDELRTVLKFTQLVSSQATDLQVTSEISFPNDSKVVVRFNSEELKARALRYLSELKKMDGAHYIITMMEHPLHQFHISQFLYSDVMETVDEREFNDDNGNVLAGISISPDLSLKIRFTDKFTLTDIAKRLNQISNERDEAKKAFNYAKLDDLFDEEEQLLQYVHKARTEFSLNDRAHKDYQIILQAIKRVIKKIRTHEKYKDAEVADYLTKHIITGMFCYWDE